MAISQEQWEVVRSAVRKAKGITWDECHKIYVLMDDEQVEKSKGWGYDPIFPTTEVGEAMQILQEWYMESCGLKFISAVSTVEGDPNKGYRTLIAQGDDDEDEEDY
jgi:hypothetical protein